ncbi:MAG TPA: hypothetical protein VMM55_01840 [Thermohalobaculum sp.]|nr:hypothetical protein [Thermohalobaculum sp.]
MNDDAKPIVLITGATGSIGSARTRRLGDRYRVVGLDLAAGLGRMQLEVTVENQGTGALEIRPEALDSGVHLLAGDAAAMGGPGGFAASAGPGVTARVTTARVTTARASPIPRAAPRVPSGA